MAMLSMGDIDGRWVAVQVYSRRESAITHLLTMKGYESFLPVIPEPNYKQKETGKPMFPGYVFCRINLEIREPIVMTPGVVRIVGNGRRPIPIEEDEIESIRILVSRRLKCEPHPFIVGDRIAVESGALAGMCGTVLQVKNKRCLIASITILARCVRVELELDAITAVPDSSWSISGGLGRFVHDTH
jgi:transcriptional antiterminator RfaH